MSDPDTLRAAAHHLLAAARPSNPNPTPSTLAAALAMSQAGLCVVATVTQGTNQTIVLQIPGPDAWAMADAQPLYRDGVQISIQRPGRLEDGCHEDADALTAALRALLEGQ